MNIVTRDTRDLTDVSPITFQAKDIIFHEMKITGNFAGDIEDMIKGNLYFVGEDTQKFSLNNNIEIFDMGGNFFVVEYNDEAGRNKDISLLKQRFEESGKFAKELDEQRQVPEFEGYFEYNGKYYIIVNGLNKLTQEINPEKGVYKGVIVNPSKYFEVENEVQNIAKEVGDIL